jgi:signal transduction histidine kinase
MKSTGIKSHITVILAILLAAGQLLISMVVISFWQQSLMRAEMEKAMSTLSAVASMVQESTGAPDENGGVSPGLLEHLRQDLGASCTVLSANNLTRLQGECGPEESVLNETLKQVVTAGVASLRIIDAGQGLPFLGHKVLIGAVPLEQHGGRGSIGTVISLQSVYEEISQGREIAYVYILVNVIILTTIGLFRLIQVVVRPIERLVTLTNTYQSQESSPFFSDQEGNEFGRLSLALNKMVHRIDDDRLKLRETVESLAQANQQLRATQQKMVQTEKMAAIGRLSAGLAHEIGNPLGIVQGYLEMLGQDDLSPEEHQQFSSRSLQELERINRLIHQLLDFAKTRINDTGNAEIHPLIQELVGMLQDQKKLSGLEFQLHLDAENDRVAASSESVHQVILNSLLNALDAIAERHAVDDIRAPSTLHKGIICLSTANTTDNEGRTCVRITIKDNGIGIKDKDLHNLFDPFFTTKEPGKGTGLGLAVSYALVEGANGQMQIQGKEGQGATVVILLPLWADR